jgi:hypothetical protein
MTLPKTLKLLGYLDWVLGLGTIAWGLYFQSPLIAASGVLGLAVAYFKPAERIKARMEKRMLRKKTKPHDTASVLAEEAFYAKALGRTDGPGIESVAPAAPVVVRGSLPPSVAFISANPHNMVKPSHLDLMRPAASAGSSWA